MSKEYRITTLLNDLPSGTASLLPDTLPPVAHQSSQDSACTLPAVETFDQCHCTSRIKDATGTFEAGTLSYEALGRGCIDARGASIDVSSL